MDVSQVSSVSVSPAVTAIAREIQTMNEMQMAIMKSIADSQQQMTERNSDSKGLTGSYSILMRS